MFKNKRLKAIFAPEFLEFLSQRTTVLLYQKEGVWHAKPSYYCSEGLQTRSKIVKLSELPDENVCETCLGGNDYYSLIGRDTIFATVERIVELRMSAINKGKFNAKTSAGAIQGRIVELERSITDIQAMRLNVSGLDEPLEKLEELTKEVLKKLQAASSSDDAKDKLEKAVQRHLVPKKFKDQSFELDPTMVLIGISPTPSPNYWSNNTLNTVQAVLKAYSIRNDTATVLYAPAYFYSYLLGVLFFKNKEQTLVVSAAAPDDAEARDNAAHLWDPQNESVLACLSKATLSGEALSG